MQAARDNEGNEDDALDRLERSIRNYHDSGCFIYLPSGACDCGMSVDQDALAALATVREALERQRGRIYILENMRSENYIEALEAAEAEVRRLTEGLRETLEAATPLPIWKPRVFMSELGKHGCITCACISAGRDAGRTHNGSGPHCPGA